MKKCPSCERTFEDNMRFCQSDGTPLVDDAPPLDPYKTMVASSGDIASALAVPADASPKQEDEVLQLPAEADPKKTMYASEEEIRKEMDAHEEPVMDLPPLAPEPPKFSEPSLSPPSFGDMASPPASPFSRSDNEPISNPTEESPFSKTTPPIPSPFDNPKPATYEAPPSPNFSAVSEPEPVSGSAAASLDAAAAASDSASAPIQNWEPNEPMQNAPVSSAGAGQNKTLAIVSLVLGVLSILCCGLLAGIPAIITGFMAKGKANSDPVQFGGSGLATAGIVLGFLSIILTIVVVVLQIMFGVFGNLPR